MITGYFGLPGAGKTTFLTKIAQKELRRIAKGRSPYEKVLTNFYCEGCYKIDYGQLGKYNIERCLILLDELTLDADSRNFKQFDIYHKDFFIMHRHDLCNVIYFTQQYDGIDKKIRDLTHTLYFVKSARLLPISRATRIYRQLDINEFTKDIVQGYRFANIWDYIFGTKNTQYCWRPSWYKYFNTHEKSELQKQRKAFNFKLWQENEAKPKSEENEPQEVNRAFEAEKKEMFKKLFCDSSLTDSNSPDP